MTPWSASKPESAPGLAAAIISPPSTKIYPFESTPSPSLPNPEFIKSFPPWIITIQAWSSLAFIASSCAEIFKIPPEKKKCLSVSIPSLEPITFNIPSPFVCPVIKIETSLWIAPSFPSWLAALTVFSVPSAIIIWAPALVISKDLCIFFCSKFDVNDNVLCSWVWTSY